MIHVRHNLHRKHSPIGSVLRKVHLTQPSFADREIYAKHTRKVFLPNPAKIKQQPPIKPQTPPYADVKLGIRTNNVDIQMLSKSIYQQVFKDSNNPKPPPMIVEQCQKALLKHGMVKGKDFEYMPDVNFKIPNLLGKDLKEHFQIVGEEQAKPYRTLVLNLLEHVPPKPTSWLMQPGWTRYAPNCDPQAVPYPSDDALVLDIEVCVPAGKAPTLATAVSNTAWYGWVSQAVLDGTSKPVTTHQYLQETLIPLESTVKDRGFNLEPRFSRPRAVIGHNVSYDRARIKEQYWIERTGVRFIDTMSLHVCVGGLTSYQRAVLKSGDESAEDEAWKNLSSLNNLSDVHKLYCGKELQKETRDIFVQGSLADVNREFQNVMNYCANDVQATYDVLKCLFHLFLERFPHPVTLAGMLELSTAYLPVNSNWDRYIDDSEQTYEDLDIEGRFILARRADQACQLLHDDKYKEDIWMWDQDWEIKNIKLRKKVPTVRKQSEVPEAKLTASTDDEAEDLLEKRFKYLEETCNLLPAVKTLLPGYPNWYRKLCTKSDSSPDWVPGPHLISTGMQVTPKLLGLTWEGYPLHFIRGKGWGLLVPFTEDTEARIKLPLKQLVARCPVLTNKPMEASGVDVKIDKEVQENLSKREYYSRLKKDKTEGLYKGSGVWSNTVLEDCCWFFKLPHKDGESHRVGNPLAKDFLNKFSESVLAGDTESAEKVLSIARMLSYWRNNRARIMDQMVVWLNDGDLPRHLRSDGRKYGAILPQVVVSGTLTRRAVEPTWMTASNAHLERVGSELRAMVQAPQGYSIVGADVDSQELWIASVIGDSHFAKMHGATPFGWMTLGGNKADGTDMHSVTAKAVGISRDHAKVINYARIYGAGQNFAEQLLRQFNPTMSESEARNKASKMFALTKGKRVFYLREEFLLDFPDQPYGRWQALEMAKLHGKKVEEMFTNPKWVGGTESAMFNRLEEIARDPEPTTPFLDGRLSRALEPSTMPGDRFLPTRVNWVVQSGAVDFLHLMLVCMRWIMHDRARFCLSFHDEVRYMVPEEYKYKAALAMHVTNLLTRSFCALKLGLNDLPQSVAFFSSVEVDTVLRKESKQDCKTPSNPHGLQKGYGISSGESLDIYQAVEKAGGQYVWWGRNMSRATKRKHVLMEVLQDDFSLPTENQQIVKVLSSRGNNLHEVESAEGSVFLTSMPTKFRKNVWVKRGDFVLVEPIEEGDKVKAEMVRVLTSDHVRYFKKDGVWPAAFDGDKEGELKDDDGLFVNTNRLRIHAGDDDSSSGSDTETQSDSDTEASSGTDSGNDTERAEDGA